MKFLFTLILFINSALGFSQEAEFSILKPIFKFPKTIEGNVVEHTYVYTNTGSSPLLIQDFLVACTCTKVYYSKDPIMPGKTGEVRVVFDTNGKYDFQDRIVTLIVNTKKKKVKLRFKIFVLPKEE